MKLQIDLPPDKFQDFLDEMHFACTQVSILPVMEEVLRIMES